MNLKSVPIGKELIQREVPKGLGILCAITPHNALIASGS